MINNFGTLVGSVLAVSAIMTSVLYLALTNRLDDRYMKEKDCEIKAEASKTITNVMIKAIRDDICELKASNKTIFEKLDILNEHIITLVGGMK